jgi:ABC-2 type transport system ATP-binding protein
MAATAFVTSAPPAAHAAAPIAFQNSVASLHGVSKSYGSTQALKDLNLDLRPGEVLSLLGPNGAGKTTAVRLLLGLTRPSAGSVSVFGRHAHDPLARVRIGAMLQIARVPETLKVREHINLFRSYYPAPLPLPQILATAGIEDIANRLFGTLSGGQKQRVLFAIALCGNPDLIFLDEPTVGMDIEARRGLWFQVRNLAATGKTILLTTHYIEEADALSDRVAVLNHGHVIAQGTPSQIKEIVSGRKVRCVTRLSPQALLAIPSVTTVVVDRDAFILTTADAESVTRELLRADPTLRNLEISSAALEDAFLALTKN